jgi:branched-chain amino acid aminotransferase
MAKNLLLSLTHHFIRPSARVFHYGRYFEGMKAYKDESDNVWLFNPDENYKRFNSSAFRMAMPEVPETIFMDGLNELLKLDEAWKKKKEIHYTSDHL